MLSTPLPLKVVFEAASPFTIKTPPNALLVLFALAAGVVFFSEFSGRYDCAA